MPNRVKDLRSKAKLSQRALAEAVHVSQATVQRIEAEATPISLSIAQRIADYFEEPLRKVFPTPSKKARVVSLEAYREDPLVDASASEIVRFRLRDGRDLIYEVDGLTQNRLENIIYNPGQKSFLVFTSQSKEVVLRRSEIRYMAMHDDPEFEVPADRSDPDEAYMSITFMGDSRPEQFLVNGDTVDPDDPERFEEATERNHLGSFIMHLDSAEDGEDFFAAEVLDTDGCDDAMRIVFPFDQLLLVEIPLSLLNPRLAAAEREGEDENTPAAEKWEIRVPRDALH